MDITHCECLAVVWGILLLCTYLEASRLTLRTDHHVLCWILKLADTSGKFARWRVRLLEFDFEIVHEAEIKHRAADAVSGLPTNGSNRTMLEENIAVMADARKNKQVLNYASIDATDGSHAKNIQPSVMTRKHYSN